MILRAKAMLVATVVLAVAAIAGADSATAVSITNRDDKDHKISVVEEEGAAKAEHMLKPNQVLEGICKKGCVIRLNDGEDEYVLESGDVVSIEENELFYDNEPADAPAAPANPATPPPAAQPGAPPPPVKR